MPFQRNNLDSTEVNSIIFSQRIGVQNAVTIRLKFDEYNLGQSSKIKIESVADGGTQTFDAKSLENWRRTSAIVNGNAVRVYLIKSKDDDSIYFSIKEVLIGEAKIIGGKKSICGTDDRVSIDDPRVARMPLAAGGDPSCTAWLTSNGAVITAGHCIDDGAGGVDELVDLIEFNVPASLLNGTPVASDPDDQYPIDTDLADIAWNSGGIGSDWGVMRCLPNANGVLPHQAQEEFFRMTRETPDTDEDIRITGYGADDGADFNTEQTAVGPFVSEYTSGEAISHRYVVDTRVHNSGSPIIWDDEEFTIGVHTFGGCHNPSGYNGGTSFEHDDFEDALQDFHGNNTTYVDTESASQTEDGTIFSPYNTVQVGVDNTASGGVLFITPGVYGNNSGLEIDVALTILAPPCGTIVLNPN